MVHSQWSNNFNFRHQILFFHDTTLILLRVCENTASSAARSCLLEDKVTKWIKGIFPVTVFFLIYQANLLVFFIRICAMAYINHTYHIDKHKANQKWDRVISQWANCMHVTQAWGHVFNLKFPCKNKPHVVVHVCSPNPDQGK